MDGVSERRHCELLEMCSAFILLLPFSNSVQRALRTHKTVIFSHTEIIVR